jgi:PAS domain S-box-containing protein
MTSPLELRRTPPCGRPGEQQSAILESIPDLAWLKDRDRRFIAVNKPFGNACGHPADELVGKNDLDIWPQPLAERYQADDAEVMRAGRRKTVEEPLADATGQTKWIETIKTPVFDDDGHVIGTAGIARDITARKQMEADLLAEKERLAITLRSIGDAVITTDRDGRIVLMNPIAEDLTSWNETDAVGRPLMEVFKIVDERTREPCENPVDKVIATGQTVALGNHILLIAKDGREFTIADSGAPIRDIQDDILGVVLVFRDTTERQRMEKELLKMEKLQSLGVLAGGIAHDFNNFLTGIIGNLSLAKLDVQPGHPVLRALGEMEKAALRAKDLTQQLLTFSKGGAPVKQIRRIDELVRESAQFALRGSNVRCEFAIDDDLRPADVDEGQIAQVVHNLVINADQAMPDGGTVTIRGTNVSLLPGNPYALDPGDYVQLCIQDQGTGIKREHLKKVFDPYYTTKQKGSGLGLAVAYSIVARHDGQLTVDSTLGWGTTFTLAAARFSSTAESRHPIG